MTTLHLCPAGWQLYEKWDKLCAVSHEMTAEEVTAENQAWTAYQDHKAACPECKKVRNG
jgi:hypothetical protein